MLRHPGYCSRRRTRLIVRRPTCKSVGQRSAGSEPNLPRIAAPCPVAREVAEPARCLRWDGGMSGARLADAPCDPLPESRYQAMTHSAPLRSPPAAQLLAAGLLTLMAFG